MAARRSNSFETERPSLTVTDVKMPIMDGLEFLGRARALDADTVVLDPDRDSDDVRTAVAEPHAAAPSISSSSRWITDVLSFRAAQQRSGTPAVARSVAGSSRRFLERRVAEKARELQVAVGYLQDTCRSTLEALGAAIESRDAGTQAHSWRVRGYSLALAQAHGVPEDRAA